MQNTNYSAFKPRYNETPLNFVDDPYYCLHSDKLKLVYPDMILEDRYVLRDLDKNNL
jgi:tubulin polyglutamylase TTLL1